MLGKSGVLHPSDQTKSLYNAEIAWRESNPEAGKTVSLQGAKDKIGEIIHSPSSDHFPGIERVRAEYDPKNVRQVSLTSTTLPRGLMAGTDARGRVYMRGHGLRMGVVTHEAAHLANLYGEQYTHQGLNEPSEHREGKAGYAHQWAFARSHLYVIHHELEKNAAKHLHEIYEQHGVDYRPPHD